MLYLVSHTAVVEVLMDAPQWAMIEGHKRQLTFNSGVPWVAH